MYISREELAEIRLDRAYEDLGNTCAEHGYQLYGFDEDHVSISPRYSDLFDLYIEDPQGHFRYEYLASTKARGPQHVADIQECADHATAVCNAIYKFMYKFIHLRDFKSMFDRD